MSMQVLKTEHNSQRGSVFALLCGVVVIFAIVNIDKVIAMMLAKVCDLLRVKWSEEFMCSVVQTGYMHAVYIKHEMYCGGGFICR